MDIGNSIKFPTTDDAWIKKVIIGGILGLIPIVNFVVAGYYLKVVKETIEGKSGMPAWEDWGSLFIKGIISIIIYLIYIIIPIIVMAVTLSGVITAIIMSAGDPNAAMVAISGALAGLLISVILLLLFTLMVPMALAMYAKEESIGAAFRLGEILSRIKSVIGGYILAFIVLLVLCFILGIIGMIPFVGWIIFIFAEFYILTVGAYMFGKLYTESSA